MKNTPETDLKVLSLVKQFPSTYRIVVDNDCIWVDAFDYEELDYYPYHQFDDYGSDFIVYILNLLGYRTEGV